MNTYKYSFATLDITSKAQITSVQFRNDIGGVKSSFNIVATYSDGTLAIGGAEGCTVHVVSAFS